MKCAMKCPITGANVPRLLICIIIGSLFLFSFEFIMHDKILMQTYMETMELWRSPEAMHDNFSWNIVRMLSLVAIIALIYTRNHEGKGVCEGLRFGLMIGALLGVDMASAYIWMPISGYLAVMWFVSGIVIGLGLGLINSIFYKSVDEETCAAKES